MNLVDPVEFRVGAIAQNVLKRFKHTTYTIEDLIQDCWVAYLRNDTYYHRRIVDAMRNWHEGCPTYLPSMCTLSHVTRNIGVCNIEHNVLQDEYTRVLQVAIATKLTDKERLVIMLHWLQEKTLSEIAIILSCSKPNVNKISIKAMKKLKRHFNKRGMR